MDNIQVIDDGITHINIFSRGETALGRSLSNFSKCQFTHPKFGTFNSVEGFWFWLGTRNEDLRYLYGYNAKKFGSSLENTIELSEEEFQKYIKEAIFLKIQSDKGLKNTFLKSELPFTHYYYFGKDKENAKIVDAGYHWLVDYHEFLRTEMKSNQFINNLFS